MPTARSTPSLRQQLQHAPGAGAEVEHRSVGAFADDVEDRRFDDRVGSVQRALLVPVVGDAGEVLLGGGGAAAAHDLEPVEVDRRDGVVVLDAGQQVGDELGDRPLADELEERPRAFPVLVDHARLGEQLEVARDARLGLAEDVGEVGDGQLAVLQQGDDPQAGLLADRAQHVEDGVGAECHPATI